MNRRLDIKDRLMAAVMLLPLMLATSCSPIDEDLSDCVTTEDYKVDYELRLVTNMTTELQTVLSLQADVNMVAALTKYLSTIFTDHAKDVDLSFYDTTGDSLRMHHKEDIINANQSTYTLNLPRQKYMHAAIANKLDNPVVDVTGDDRCHRSRLLQLKGDTIDAHTTGVFTARQPMEMVEGVDQTFNVHLYMANCAAALVVDTTAVPIARMRVYATGFASAFNIVDSIYVYDPQPSIVRTQRITDAADGLVSFCTVNFPSQDPEATRSIIETEEPFIADDASQALWQFLVYVTLPDGSITETRLGLTKPLRAGQLKILRVWLNPDGSVESNQQEVVASVTLDWKEGTHYEPIF